jgi:nucleoid-associated protein YgaU
MMGMRGFTNKQHASYIRRRFGFRVVAFLLFVSISATSGVMLHANAMDDQMPVEGTKMLTVGTEEPTQAVKKRSLLCVEPGDTLWRIAKKYGPEGVSVKKYVQQIVEQNQLETANLQVGQVLQLP